MSKGITLEELHRFFEDDPDDFQLETQAESRLKALYNCLLNGNSRTTLQIGLTGLLVYVKASQRSSIIDELLLSKDYISEIIAMAADHFINVPLLSASCLYECMLNYPKKFSPFLINKFRPVLPRVIYKKISGPDEISCKCLAQLSVLGIPSSSKQAKSWKNEFEHYLNIASLLADQLYAGINEPLCSEIHDLESALAREIGDLISPSDYAAVFSNCCHILRYLLYVPLDSPVTVPTERTLKLIFKILTLNAQQFNVLHRKQHLAATFEPCLQLCDALVTFNPSSMTFNLRTLMNSTISLLDMTRSHTEYLKLSIRLYEILTNFFAIYHRQIKFDLDALQKLVRWIIHDSTQRPRSKIPVQNQSKVDHRVTRVVLNCVQQLINIYSDQMPKDQFLLIQNHFVYTLLTCQSTNATLNKPYDDESCRVGLYQMLECLLINERADSPTIIGISKTLIDRANLIDSSVKVKMASRKLKLIWQQVRDSSSHLYQPWSFLNVEKARTIIPNSSSFNNEINHIFVPPSVPLTNNSVQNSSSISMINPEQVPLMKPAVYEPPAPMDSHVPLAMSYTNLDTLPVMQPNPLESFVPHMNNEMNNREEYEQISEQKRKRPKFIDTRAVRDDDDDGAERIFDDGLEEVEEDEDEEIDDDDDEEEIDESDEVDDEPMDEENDSDLPSSEEEHQHQVHSNGTGRLLHQLGIRETNVDLLDVNRPVIASFAHGIGEKLHKKFRRSNLEFPHATNPLSAEFSSPVQHQASGMPVNGDHQTISTAPNGQETSKEEDDDDDDIVLVSDDEDEEKCSEPHRQGSFNSISGSSSNPIGSKTEAAQFLSENKDSSESIDHSSCDHSLRVETNSNDESAATYPSAVQETIEALQDAIELVSDDYNAEI